MRACVVLFIIIIFVLPGQAKVFDYTKSSFIAYLRGVYGLNKVQKYAFEPGFPTTVTFPDHYGVNQNYNAEFGIGFSSSKISTRLGVELIYPQMVKDLNGVNSSSTTLLTIISEVYSVMPKLSIEYSLNQSSAFRWFLGFAGGYGATVIKNTVTLNAAGQAFFSGSGASPSYIEEATGYALMAEVYSGIEFASFDNTSFSLDLGYHYHPVTSFTNNRNANTVRGAITSGSALTNSNSLARSIDLSGYFVSGALRIYIR